MEPEPEPESEPEAAASGAVGEGGAPGEGRGYRIRAGRAVMRRPGNAVWRFFNGGPND